MELTDEEIRMVLAERRRREAEMRKFQMAQANAVKYPLMVYEKGGLRAYKECDGKHTPWSVYDGDTLVCMCVYKKGAIAVVDYINNLKAGGQEDDNHKRSEC